MTITEIKLPRLTNKPPKFKELVYPKPRDENIQKPYYVCIAAGSRGTGKSYSIVRCIKNQEVTGGFYDPDTNNKVPIRTILMSPTVEGNPIFTALDSLDETDIINDYSHAKLQEILSESKYEKEKTKEWKDYLKAWTTFSKMTPEQFYRWKDDDAIALLYAKDFMNPKDLEPPKYPDGVVCNIILDDCLSSDAFSSKKGNVLLKSVLNGRHYGINLFIAAQNLKSVNKAIRGNTELFMLFKFCSMKIVLDDLYPEISALVTEDQFIDIYAHATQDDHDCLVIDKKAEKGKQFKRNLDVVLSFDNKKDKKEITETPVDKKNIEIK